MPQRDNFVCMFTIFRGYMTLSVCICTHCCRNDASEATIIMQSLSNKDNRLMMKKRGKNYDDDEKIFNMKSTWE